MLPNQLINMMLPSIVKAGHTDWMMKRRGGDVLKGRPYALYTEDSIPGFPQLRLESSPVETTESETCHCNE